MLGSIGIDPRRGRFLPLAIFLLMVCFSSQAFSLTIPAGDAEDQLRKFVSQAGWSILYAPYSLDGFKTVAIFNEQDRATALNKMLEGTGLEWIHATDRFIVVRPSKRKPILLVVCLKSGVCARRVVQ